MTLIYHMVLPLDEISSASSTKGNPRIVAADFFQTLLGKVGLSVIGLVVMASTLISLNGNALSGPRAYFAMARDGLFPASLCRIHPRFQTPANAVITQAVWSVILMIIGATLDPDRTPDHRLARAGPGRPGTSCTRRRSTT